MLNLSVHGELNLDYMYYKVKQYIGKGDVVVMPLEFEYYYENAMASDWFSVNMMAWGRDYLSSLTLLEYMKFFIAARPTTVLEGIEEKFAGTPTKILSQDTVIRELNSLWASEGVGWRGYNHLSLNPSGDINVESPVIFSGLAVYNVNGQPQVSEYFFKMYDKIRQLVTAKQGRLILTYPVTIRSPFFDLSTAESREKLARLSASLSERELYFQCNPILFNLDRKFFFDSLYHLNRSGVGIRTENLADCLNRIFTGSSDPISNDAALQVTSNREKLYSRP